VKKNTGLAAQIEADILRPDDKSSTDITKCCSCDYRMVYKGRRFCNDRCRKWYDDGNPGYAQDWLRPKINRHSITRCKVVAGPPRVEIGSDYYKPLRDAFEHRKSSKRRNKVVRLRTGNKIPNYAVKANGHGYWQPSAASRSLGFTSVDCGFDGDDARSKARALNEAARVARKQGVGAENTNREAA
jgi:hypothetical protein